VYEFLKTLGHLALPPTSLATGLVLGGLIWLVGLRRLGRLVCILAVAQVLLLSMPFFADLMMRGLQEEAVREAAKVPPCCYDAILVLGGSIAPADPPETNEPSLTDASDRLWHAARLYRKGVAPRIVVSGGTYVIREGQKVTPEADAMRFFLMELGVPADAIVTEGASLNTRQNIANVRALVGDKTVALVTSAFHMPRAMRIAREGGLKAAPFPTDWRVPLDLLPFWDRWLPTAQAQNDSTLALWEYMALIFDHRGPAKAR
jgi:uncharacterized SAM-binding protein YcdF (DUF218 family)